MLTPAGSPRGAEALAPITLIAVFAIVAHMTLLVTGFRIRRRGPAAVERVAERLGMTDVS